jgi:ubiquinone/menaquinone biosynthesis C-methylase UbiE
MVLALNLLHLLPNRTAALAKIYRLLKPGGLFISSTVCLADRMWFLRSVIPVLQWIGKALYVSFVGASDMLSEVAVAGFEEQ